MFEIGSAMLRTVASSVWHLRLHYFSYMNYICTAHLNKGPQFDRCSGIIYIHNIFGLTTVARNSSLYETTSVLDTVHY